MGAVGFIVLFIIAAACGAIAQFFPGDPGPRTRFDGIIIFVVAVLTGFVGNILKKGIGPQVDGLAYITVAIIAAVWSVIVTILLRRIGRKEPSNL